MRRNTPPAMLVATVPLAVPTEALHLMSATQHAAVVVPEARELRVWEAAHVTLLEQ